MIPVQVELLNERRANILDSSQFQAKLYVVFTHVSHIRIMQTQMCHQLFELIYFLKAYM